MKTDLLIQLEKIGFDKDLYLKIIKDRIKNYGLDPNKVNFSDKKNKKLVYDGIHFGEGRYRDFIIYQFLEHIGEIPKGKAIQRMINYRRRALNIKGKWRQNKLSPNNLAINILW
jgi:hypothetical protein